MMKGKVKTQPVANVTIGQKVLHEGKIITVKQGMSLDQLMHMQEIIVVYGHGEFMTSLPLKFSQWEHALSNKEVNSDLEIEFDLVIGKNRNIAKIRPTQSLTDSNWDDVAYSILPAQDDIEVATILNDLKAKYILIKRQRHYRMRLIGYN